MGQYVDSAACKAQKGLIWLHVGLLIEGMERARAVSSSMGGSALVPSIVSRETSLTSDVLIRVNLGVAAASRSL